VEGCQGQDRCGPDRHQFLYLLYVTCPLFPSWPEFFLVSRSLLGLDVGGANLKAAHTSGVAVSRRFALWKNPGGLTDALRDVIRSLPPADQLAVTMTGELCDCYESKRQGVNAILDAVESAVDGKPVLVWQNTGCFADLDRARSTPLQTAAANWLALATFVGRYAPAGPGLLLDVGSTTTDVVPLLDGRPVPRGRTDSERLLCRELVYLGVRRTPLCAVAGPVGAAELFATALDAYLVLGDVPEQAADCDTADGRPATRAAAHLRLARMLCADLETSTEDQRLQLARTARLHQVLMLGAALRMVAARMPGPPRTVIRAGSGEFLADRALCSQEWVPPCRVVSLERELGETASAAACAHAVAVLASERPTEGE
jgi:(4-(4-[2-(gamma-L-glutamylamino)ethyl]phenoxymethyl)furan-2-yl)methanamine synthase